jgi:hypothetical protein
LSGLGRRPVHDPDKDAGSLGTGVAATDQLLQMKNFGRESLIESKEVLAGPGFRK